MYKDPSSRLLITYYGYVDQDMPGYHNVPETRKCRSTVTEITIIMCAIGSLMAYSTRYSIYTMSLATQNAPQDDDA